MTVYLLDVNVLLALCDPRHVHHDAAHWWFSEKGCRAWATCPITEDGFFRLGLAAHKGGKLASFDEHIPVASVLGGAEALELIPAQTGGASGVMPPQVG